MFIKRPNAYQEFLHIWLLSHGVQWKGLRMSPKGSDTERVRDDIKKSMSD